MATTKHSVVDFFLLSGTVSRGRYLAVGLILFAVKFAIDWTLATRVWLRPWSPLQYLIWPDRESVTVFNLPDEDRHFGLVMLAVALPFIWVGVSYTVRRIRDAGLPLALVLLFFVPLVNLLMIVILCIVPSRPAAVPPAASSGSSSELPIARRARSVNRKVSGDSTAAAFALACLISVAVTTAFVFLSANLLQSYGFGIFVATPFVLGWLAATLYGFTHRRTVGQSLLVATVALLLSGVALIAFAFEGMICILMASPIALGLCLLGGLVGYATQSRPWANDSAPAMMIAILITLPALIAAESAGGTNPIVREVQTAVVIDAPPERVWQLVVSFPPLAAPTEPLFRTGIAYPQRAEIHGRGVGAVRHCVFSTGAFVEPIEVWKEPARLAFRVTDQPPPMEELSPFDIHPPHLDNFLVSRRGQFRLERLPDGRTRLEGTTWYTNRMWPADYWGVCSDYIIHRIHTRVLDHIRDLAESDRTHNRD